MVLIAFRLIRILFEIVDTLLNIGTNEILNHFSKGNTIKRIMAGYQRKDISTVKTGEYVLISGKVKKYKKLYAAPLSKRKCVFFQINVTTREQDNDTSIKEEAGIRFLVEGKEKNALILTKNMKLFLEKDSHFEIGMFTKSNENIEAFLKRHDTKSTFLGVRKSLSFEEGIIELDEKVSVLGNAKWMTNKETGEKLLVMSGTRKKPLYVIDC